MALSDWSHAWVYQDRTYQFRWLGLVNRPVARVYALAFVNATRLLLVSDPTWLPHAWLPGGGIEAGEDDATALARELLEEANATVLAHQLIGIQATLLDGETETFQAFYWARVQLGRTFAPEHEVSARLIVPDHAFLDTLFWGRSDPKAVMLLQEAQRLDRHFRTSEVDAR